MQDALEMIYANGTARDFGRNGVAGNGHIHLSPHDNNAECALLAAMLKENATIPTVAQVIGPHDLYAFANQQIFQAILDLHEAGEAADLVTVADWLKRHGAVEDVGYSYLMDLCDGSPTNVGSYTRIVKDYARRREAIQAIAEMQKRLQDNEPLGEIIHEFQSRLGGLTAPNSERWAKLDEADAEELAAASDADLQLPYLPLLGREGYLVKGWSHLLASYPRCGKTELLTACCRHWLAAGQEVLYITEEPRSIWKHRLGKFPAESRRRMKFVFGLGEKPDNLRKRMRYGGETIVIADTIRNLGILHTDEKDNSMLASQINPWVADARAVNKTLILAHHIRKGDGEHGQGIAGGHALLGAVDIALELRPELGRRVIQTYARLIQPLELMYEREPDGGMRALGSPKAVSLAEVRQRVLNVLDGDDWLRTKQVRDALGDPKPVLSQVQDALKEEALAGTVDRDPPITEKAKGKTVLWRKNLT
jgi:hypothetical protein